MLVYINILQVTVVWPGEQVESHVVGLDLVLPLTPRQDRLRS